MSSATAPMDDARPGPADALVTWARRNNWALSLIGFLVLLIVFTKLIQPNYGVTGIRGLGIPSCRWRSPPSPRRSSSSPAGSTSRSAR